MSCSISLGSNLGDVDYEGPLKNESEAIRNHSADEMRKVCGEGSVQHALQEEAEQERVKLDEAEKRAKKRAKDKRWKENKKKRLEEKALEAEKKAFEEALKFGFGLGRILEQYHDNPSGTDDSTSGRSSRELANDNNNTMLDGLSEMGKFKMTPHAREQRIDIPNDDNGSTHGNDGSNHGLIDGSDGSIHGNNGSIHGNDDLSPGNDGSTLGNDGLIPGNDGLIPDNNDSTCGNDGSTSCSVNGVQSLETRFSNGVNNAILGFTGQAMATIIAAHSPGSLTFRLFAYATGIGFYGSLFATLFLRKHPNIAKTLFKIGVSASAFTGMIALAPYLPTQWYLNMAVPAVVCLIIAVMVALSKLD